MATPATEITKKVNAAFAATLNFKCEKDFENSSRGLVGAPDTVIIKKDDERTCFDVEAYKRFISKTKSCPDTVNPSLWRHSQLNMDHGLFKVCDRVYQVRGFDISNMTLIEGETGWILYDVLFCMETAKAAFDYAESKLGKRPIKAILYSHSHADHFGGVAALISPEDASSGKVQVIAPEHFVSHTIAENLIVGNAMARRAVYQFGTALDKNSTACVNAGLGFSVSTGTMSLIVPNREITNTGEKLVVDGVRMEFQMTPGSEAPDEMNTYFPDFNALWMAENTTNTMHNVLTLRGALVRDASKWAEYIQETIDLYGDKAEVKFQSHHWPVWGNAEVIQYLEDQRDVYKYLHDQTVRLMNHGCVGDEISDMIKLPPELHKVWHTRGYYGTLRHNSRAVYQRYLGWFSGHPSNLDNLPQEQAAKKYISFMGGEAEAIAKASKSYDEGDYRWVAEVGKHIVMNNPKSVEGRALLAKTFDQLGYQSESAIWRCFYLQGAQELREGLGNKPAIRADTRETLSALHPTMLMDYWAVRVIPEKAQDKDIVVEWDFKTHKTLFMQVKNSVLTYSLIKAPRKADLKISCSVAELVDVTTNSVSLKDALAKGSLKFDGPSSVFEDFLAMLDSFEYWFNIIEP